MLDFVLDRKDCDGIFVCDELVCIGYVGIDDVLSFDLYLEIYIEGGFELEWVGKKIVLFLCYWGVLKVCIEVMGEQNYIGFIVMEDWCDVVFGVVYIIVKVCELLDMVVDMFYILVVWVDVMLNLFNIVLGKVVLFVELCVFEFVMLEWVEMSLCDVLFGLVVKVSVMVDIVFIDCCLVGWFDLCFVWFVELGVDLYGLFRMQFDIIGGYDVIVVLCCCLVVVVVVFSVGGIIYCYDEYILFKDLVVGGDVLVDMICRIDVVGGDLDKVVVVNV